MQHSIYKSNTNRHESRSLSEAREYCEPTLKQGLLSPILYTELYDWSSTVSRDVDVARKLIPGHIYIYINVHIYMYRGHTEGERATGKTNE